MTKSILLKLESNQKFDSEYTNLLSLLSTMDVTIQPLEGVLCCMLTSDVSSIKDIQVLLKDNASWSLV